MEIQNKFHKFDRNIRFTFDLFENSTSHFLDINIASDGLGIYGKDTFTGQYSNLESFVPWRHKISWVRALIDRKLRICTPNKIKIELKLIRKFSSWNGFPKRVANLLINRFTTNAQRMLLKRGMGNGEWEIENGKWEIDFFHINFL